MVPPLHCAHGPAEGNLAVIAEPRGGRLRGTPSGSPKTSQREQRAHGERRTAPVVEGRAAMPVRGRRQGQRRKSAVVREAGRTGPWSAHRVVRKRTQGQGARLS